MTAARMEEVRAPSQDLARLAINSATVKQWPLQRLLDGCARRGIRAVTPWREDVQAAGLKQARSWFRDAGITVSGYCRGGFFTHATKAERSAAHEENVRALDEAAELGAIGMALVAGGLPAGSRKLPEAREQVAAGIAALLDHARSVNVPLLIEPLHPMYAGDRACVNSLKQALDLCDRIDPDHTGMLGVAIDVYHLWWDPDLQAQIRRAGRSRLQAFHICDWLVPTKDMLLDRGMMGDGVIDIRRIRGWAEAAGYDGLYEVEIFSAADWWKRDGDEVLDTCIARYQQVA